MSRWGSAFRIAVAYVVGAYTGNWALLASTMEGERQRRKRDKNNQRARQQFNDALKDRLELIDLQPDAPRTLCLGRVRYVEGIRDRWSSGANDELLTMFVSVAGHEIDAFEQWYLDDVAVTLDGSGWVQTAPWLVTDRRTESVSRTGDGTVTLPVGYVAGTALVTWSTGSGDSTTQGSGSISVTGTGPYTGTVSGTTSGSAVTVSYQRDVGTSHVRIRPYLGTDTQSVGGDVAAEYPGKIDATDHFRGIAGALIDFKFNPNVFPQSYPTPTAVFRGAKCYDWRKDSTVPGGSGAHRKATPSTWQWSENPAVCSGRYFSWRAGWNCSLDWARAADMQAAADVCDTSTSFDVAGTPTTLPLYRCGLTISAAADHAEAMDSIMETMAGRHVWSGNTWRMRAGAMATPVLTVDESWFGHVGAPGGEPDDEPVIRAAQSLPREARTNRVIGKCVDPDQRYQLLPFPAVEDSVLVAAKGERQDEIDLPGVSHIAHAQNLAKIVIREAQAGLRLQCSTGWRGLLAEPLDVASITVSRLGMSAKTAEVTGWSFGFNEGTKLKLAEIADAIFDPTEPLDGRDPAPDSDIRRPWDVEQLTGLTVTSGAAAVLDTSILTRTQVSWTAPTGQNIRSGGYVEIQYTPAAETVPTGDWPSWTERGNGTATVVPGLLTGRFYLFRARFVQGMPLVEGPWSAVVRHQIAARRSTKIFRQTTAPTGDVIDGDEWFDTDDGNRYYVRVSGTWTETSDGNKVATYVQASAPTAKAVGDLWVDSDDGNKVYRWDGSAWVALPFDAGAIQPGINPIYESSEVFKTPSEINTLYGITPSEGLYAVAFFNLPEAADVVVSGKLAYEYTCTSTVRIYAAVGLAVDTGLSSGNNPTILSMSCVSGDDGEFTSSFSTVLSMAAGDHILGLRRITRSGINSPPWQNATAVDGTGYLRAEVRRR